MKKKLPRPAKAAAAVPTPTRAEDFRREVYKGHEIIIPRDERQKRLFIDGRPVRYGTASGKYYLDVYAYDRAASLEEVIKRYLNYKEQTDGRRKEGK